MKFKFASERPQFTWPVKVRVPVDGGKFQDQTFTGCFRACPRSVLTEHLERQARAIKAAQAAAGDGTGDDGRAQADRDVDAETEIMREYFVGWGDDLVGEDGQPLPYSDEMRDRLLDVAFVRRAVTDAYWTAMNGGARAKN